MGQGWLYAFIPLGIGAVFFTIGFVPVRRFHLLRRHGAKAYGQVVDLVERSSGNSVRHHPVVRWTTADGHDVRATSATGRHFAGAFRAGRVVLVHYDPRRPQRMAIEGFSPSVEWLFCVIGAVLLAGTLTVLALAAL